MNKNEIEVMEMIQEYCGEKITQLEEVRSGGEGDGAYTIYHYELENGYDDLVATHATSELIWRANDESLFDNAFGDEIDKSSSDMLAALEEISSIVDDFNSGKFDPDVSVEFIRNMGEIARNAIAKVQGVK